MSIRAVCPNCQHAYQVGENWLGKKVRCQKCQATFAVEQEPQFEVVEDDEPVATAPRPRRRIKKSGRKRNGPSSSHVIGIVAAGIAVVLMVIGGWWFWNRTGSARNLSQLIAQLDRAEPGWRFSGLEAQRQTIPPEQNSATTINSVRKQLAKNWMSAELQESISRVAPNQKLDAGTLGQIKQALDGVESALVEARKIANMPKGRHPIVYAQNGQLTDTPHLMPLRDVTKLLLMDATWSCQNADANGAATACQAALNVGRSVYDEPFSMSQLVRLACQNLTVTTLERVLAQSQPVDERLASLQELLLDESNQPTYVIVAKCERAFTEDFWSALHSGAMKPDDAKKLSPELETKSAVLNNPAEVEKAYFWMLRHTNQLVEIARLPPHQLQKQLEEWDKLPPDAPPLAAPMQMAGSKMATACQRGSARLACAATALAAERYRRAKGQWPDKLDSLTPEFIKQIPTDPFDGKPLRLAKMPGGIVIYAVGPDLQDNSGTMDMDNPNRVGVDTGVRLFDR